MYKKNKKLRKNVGTGGREAEVAVTLSAPSLATLAWRTVLELRASSLLFPSTEPVLGSPEVGSAAENVHGFWQLL